jgi:hypothetical protein
VLGKLPLKARGVLWLGIALRLCLLPLAADDDMARYVWEGRMVDMGYNPYKLPPASPDLAPFRDDNWNRINHKNLPTIYPPLAEGLFAALAAVLASPFFFKGAFLLLDVAAFALLLALLKRRGAENSDRIAAVYFLNPLLMVEVAWHGHYESLVLLCLIAFLWAMERNRDVLASLFLFLGASAKIVSLSLLPLLVLRRGVHGMRGIAFSVLILAATAAMLKFSGAASALGAFAVDFQYNSAFPFLLHALGWGAPRAAERMLILAFFCAAGVTAAIRLRHDTPERQGLVFLGLLLLFSPTLHPWYLLWILPFAALRRSLPWLLLTGTICVTYAVYAQAAATGRWQEIPWLRLPEFLPPLGLWLWTKRRVRSA